ncbi:RagB/SusD family nutrient uptake outer membrane protein [Pedobacter alluvionis]|uniref:Putative outer membrane starch-binding protein n=1 Tax=Pedobacter alluvionis TaxID=475253 RepID=A0A497Y8N4_9SPHI|nr:RagB/SusD family nutrient uptake outer membrane protein [Pedobacter alluvionis]RLJ79545.1 putative outer membrane starch-binding protein [Pedobacter alluvionis]TFB30888.1 RagB/SusD family nutrient uptake outer membrane protein [Pedobacter alluvionis]
MKIYFNKKNKLNTIVFILLGLAVLSSCKKYLDVVPNELVTEDKVWGNINNANGALANLYSGLPTAISPNGEALDEITAATDESFHHWGAGFPSLKYNDGAWNTVDNPFGNWTEQYQKIRKANLFLENIDQVPIPGDQATYYATRIPHYKAEARFLRAMFYFELLKRYGGVPIITKSYSVADAEELKTVARNSVDEVVSFIVSECEDVAPMLLTVHPDAELGRVNKGAALALAAKTLLYAASPLFNGNPTYASIKNKDGKALFSSAYDKEKWKKAADAAKKVLDYYNNVALPRAYGNDDINSYAAIFNTREWTETILAFTLPKNKVLDLSLNAFGGPFGGWGQYSPLQELVDSYEMKNGFPINHPGSGYQKDGVWSEWFWGGDGTNAWVYLDNISNRFKNRDPRFYATISFHNSKWAAVRTSQTPIRLAYWGSNNGVSQAWPKSGGTYTVSGYNVRKWLDPKVDPTNWWTSPDAQRNYPIFRLAEFYLAYAEALNEYYGGPNAEAFTAINKVRARVNMPALPVAGVAGDNTQVGFRNRVQNEKRIEFAFEGHRFWDVRRWLIAETVDNGPVHGLNARPTTAELTATGLDPQSQAAGLAAFYKETVIQTRVFVKRHYLMPIPQREIDVNKELVQNFGW